MSGEGDDFDRLRKFTNNIDSKLFGFLGNQTPQDDQQPEQLGGRWTTVDEQDADGFGVAPIKTKMRTTYFSGGGEDQWINDEWFNGVPKPQQHQNLQPVMTRKAFGPLVEKPNIDEFRAAMLTVHNNYRVRHGISPLNLNDGLNQQAQKWADYLAEYNFFKHSDDNGYGENLYTTNLSNQNVYPTAEEVCDSWYNEMQEYEYGRDPFNSEIVEHFTQMVWRITTELGVGMARAEDGAVYVVANYIPCGNIPNQYASNVFPPGPQQITRALKRSYQDTYPQPISYDSIRPHRDGVERPVLNESLSVHQYRQQMLDSHNKHRVKHGVKFLTLSDKLNWYAQEWAEVLANRDELEHRDPNFYGENISSCWSSDRQPPNADETAQEFYDEISGYTFGADPDGSAIVGHFTQLVWAGTKELGVGVAQSHTGMWYTVCNYNPAGNVDGQYRNHVFRPTSQSVPIMESIVQIPPPPSKHNTTLVDQEFQTDVPPFIKMALNQHNIYRKRHDVPFLKISEDLNRSAQEWAEQCAVEGEILAHDDESPYGECISNLSSYEANFYPDAVEICRDFYNEVSDYEYTVDPENANVSHFTQMVWKATTEMGVGIAKSENEDYFVVFQYNPRGNVEGQYRFNVFHPLSVFVPQFELATESTLAISVEKPTEEELDEAAVYQKQVEQFRNMVVAIHNMYRLRHGAPELKLSEELDIYAQESAELLAEAEHCHHRVDCKYGENCSRYISDDPEFFPSAETVCHDYYKEIDDYRWIGTPDKSENVFHFTQLVWYDSTQIGIGLAKSKQNHFFIVINYNPKGSLPGLFDDNVYPVGTKKRPPKLNEFVVPKAKISLQSPNGTLNLNKFRNVLANQHNIYRKHHGAEFVQLSDIINHHAQEWAEKCAKNDLIEYCQGEYGENIYCEINADLMWYPSPVDVGKLFYNGYKNYKYGPIPDPGTDEFTQMIWQRCAEIGIGVAKADSGRVFVVVHYSPKGNVAGEYGPNVLPVGSATQQFVTMNAKA